MTGTDALILVNEMQNKLAELYEGHPEQAVACLVYTKFAISIGINDIELWDDQNGFTDEETETDGNPTVDRLIACYRNILSRMFVPFDIN